ncbi:hypothetical protein [Parapedobacter lycopersici]|uniref:hypothetical protein n=1 Tax=Parapedobacter lycopersici TaxID=1864939 RepID=UPI00334153A7
MKVLITGLNNYLARKVAACLAEEDYEVTCLIRNRKLFREHISEKHRVNIMEGDLFRGENLAGIDADTAVAFYFNQTPVNALDMRIEMELLALQKYIDTLKRTACQHLIYVTKLVDGNVDKINSYIRDTGLNYTIVRASNIIGKGSVLMTILAKMSMQRLVLVSREFAKSRCQPVYLADICTYFNYMLLDPRTYGETYDIGGPEVMTYKEIFERYLDVLKLRRKVMTLPALGTLVSNVMTRYVYRFEQDISAALNLNVRRNLICKKNGLRELYPLKLTPFREAIPVALGLVEIGSNKS